MHTIGSGFWGLVWLLGRPWEFIPGLFRVAHEMVKFQKEQKRKYG